MTNPEKEIVLGGMGGGGCLQTLTDAALLITAAPLNQTQTTGLIADVLDIL